MIAATFEQYRAEHNLSADHPTIDNHRFLWQLERRVEDEKPTVIPPCPSWCTESAGHDYPSYDGALDGQPISYQRHHVAFEGDFLTVDATEHNVSGVVRINEPTGYLYGEQGSLTTAQIRAVAAEMLQAAGILETITSR